MSDPVEKIKALLNQDRRYKFEAYAFVFDSLRYAQESLGMGAVRPSAPDAPVDEEEASSGGERHLTGQQLCEAIRRYALEQFGYMAKCVLNSWGIHSTGDFGEIVFNLIRIGTMKKTEDDRREDFDNVYDFDEALRQGFRIEQSK